MTGADRSGPALPSGRVTFLMTDIEGSTRLFESLGEAYPDLLARHTALLREAVGRHGGTEVDTEGDALVVAFADPVEAVLACVEGQLALRAHAWPSGAAIRVRMGLDTAEATPVDGQYVSLALHRAARVCAGGHGGQILMSQGTATEARAGLPEEVRLRPLGSYQLRGFAEPTPLLQVTHPLLPGDFPPLRAQGVVHHNLPFHRSGLVGRERERAELAAALRRTGVVTVVGPGGVGKTRLAVQVALDVVDGLDDGAWLVDLATAASDEDVAGAVAASLGVTGRPGRTLQEAVLEHLSTRSALVLLDNCEQVVDPVAVLAEQLARRAPQVVVLATSREPLGIEGEVVWPLGPLPLPRRAPDLAVEELAEQDAVRLFVERATLVRPAFALDEDNAEAVARIVAHVDGIPLAIELAAAALADHGVEAVLAGLADRFSLLTYGRRTAPRRHRTLQAALEWSLDLLEEGERLLFARLGAFAAGGAVADTGEVCGAPPLTGSDVPRLIRRLGRASLLSVDDGDRWRMLESVHELARLETARRGETAQLAERHRDHYLQRVEELGPEVGLRGRGQVVLTLTEDLDNVRRAMSTGVEAGDAPRCLRLATALTRYRMSRGDWSAGIAHLQEALALPGGTDTLRAPALDALASLMLLRGAAPEAEGILLEAEALATAVGDETTLARSRSGLGYVAFRRSDLDGAQARWRDALGHAERADDPRVVAGILRSLAIAVASHGDQAGAGALLDRAIQAADRAGDDQQLRLVLASKAEVEIWLGDYGSARELYTKALDLATTIGDVPGRPHLLRELGWVAFLSGDLPTADRLARDALATAEELRHARTTVGALRLLAEVRTRAAGFEEAERLLARALALAEELADPAESAGVRCAWACAALEQQDLAGAAAHAQEALARTTLGHTLRATFPQWVLGMVRLAEGDPEAAARQFRAGIEEGASAGAPRHQANGRWGLARVATVHGDLGEAARLHGEALRLRRRIGDRHGVAESLLAGAELVARHDRGAADAMTSAALRQLDVLGAAVTPRLAAQLAAVARVPTARQGAGDGLPRQGDGNGIPGSRPEGPGADPPPQGAWGPDDERAAAALAEGALREVRDASGRFDHRGEEQGHGTARG